MKDSLANVDASAVQAADKVLHGLIGVYKKLCLYSHAHVVYQDALKTLKHLLDQSLEQYGRVGFQVELGKISFNGTVLYEGEVEPTDPTYLLHRDGILWLEIQKGVQLWEIDTLLKILHDHCLLDEDPEDDIVTALWAVNLPSILYDAAELELDFQDDIDIPALPGTPDPTEASDVPEDEKDRNEPIHSPEATNILQLDGRDDIWELTEEESRQLGNMIVVERKLDGSCYAIDALLYILQNHALEEDAAELFDSLQHELHEALVNLRFTYLLDTIDRLNDILVNDAPTNQWVAPHIRQFFGRLAEQSFLSGLGKIQFQKQAVNASRLKHLKRFLMHLDTSAILSLGPIMTDVQSKALQQVLLEVIGTMAMRDYDTMEKLVAKADAALATRLALVLGFLKGSRPRQTLEKLLCHACVSVRLQALKALIKQAGRSDSRMIDHIVPLVDDPDERIRKLVLNHLSRQRSVSIENRLLNYLAKDGLRLQNNSENFLAICLALGRCGSESSLPYLIKMLYRWPRFGVLRSSASVQRKGALIALGAMQNQKAQGLIRRSNRGFWGNLFRSAHVDAV